MMQKLRNFWELPNSLHKLAQILKCLLWFNSTNFSKKHNYDSPATDKHPPMKEIKKEEKDDQGRLEDPIPGAGVGLGHSHPSSRFPRPIARTKNGRNFY
jgi:hypothetical protein